MDSATPDQRGTTGGVRPPGSCQFVRGNGNITVGGEAVKGLVIFLFIGKVLVEKAITEKS